MLHNYFIFLIYISALLGTALIAFGATCLCYGIYAKTQGKPFIQSVINALRDPDNCFTRRGLSNEQ